MTINIEHRTSNIAGRTHCLCAAFTLIELLVVIAIIAILASLLIPGLVRSKRTAQGIVCLNNVKQFSYAWKLYTQDNEERLPPNAGGMYGGAPEASSWVMGLLDNARENVPDNTNIIYLQTSLLAPYLGGSVQNWRCPSDHSVAWEWDRWYPRVRSYSMNALLDSVTLPDLKTSSLIRPAQVFLFLDEREDSISDCKFKMILDYGPDKLMAIPGSYHNGSAAFSFADGHAEKHRWLDRRTDPPLNPRWRIGIPWNFPPGRPNPDVIWLREHAAYWENPVFDESMR